MPTTTVSQFITTSWTKVSSGSCILQNSVNQDLVVQVYVSNTAPTEESPSIREDIGRIAKTFDFDTAVYCKLPSRKKIPGIKSHGADTATINVIKKDPAS